MSDVARRVLVTGASGFIGRHALGPLLDRGFEVHAVTSRETPPAHSPPEVAWHRADLLDAAAHGELLGAIAPSHLLHLAWYTEHGRFWEAPDNVPWAAATLGLVQEFADTGGRRAVLAGTCVEYALDGDGPLDERRSPTRPSTLYGVCKDATRRVAEHVAPELAWGRIFFLYGPGEHPGRLVASVARALVAEQRAATTAGTQIRDFMAVEDVASAFAALVDSEVTGAVNVASGQPVTVREVVEAIGDQAGRRDLLDVGALAQRPGEPAQIVADVRRLREEVGWRPALELREGLARTVAWWRVQSR